jgi:hypothetical protein
MSVISGQSVIVTLAHDLVRKRSIVSLVWTTDPEKGVALPVPFGYSLEESVKRPRRLYERSQLRRRPYRSPLSCD